MNVVKKLLPRTWRSAAMHQKYEEGRQQDVISGACPMCDAPSEHEFIHWRIVENLYPYDAIAIRHDLLVTKRHIHGDRDLTTEERAELFELKESYLNERYVMLMEAFPKNKSIPGHHHLHLMVPKIID